MCRVNNVGSRNSEISYRNEGIGVTVKVREAGVLRKVRCVFGEDVGGPAFIYGVAVEELVRLSGGGSG